MNNNIALIEFSKIAVGIKAVDEMLKAAEVNLLHSRFICPGKYSVLISGNLSNVEAALFAGLDLAKKQKAVVAKFLIANIADEVLEIIEENSSTVKEILSLGILEYNNIAIGIRAADTAVKSSKVELVKLRLAMMIGGKSVLIFTGDTEACKQALNTIESKINNKYLISKVLISNPSLKLKKELLK
ncbi:MAG: BMC domain-containing protein [bacterium]